MLRAIRNSIIDGLRASGKEKCAMRSVVAFFDRLVNCCAVPFTFRPACARTPYNPHVHWTHWRKGALRHACVECELHH